MEMGFSPRNLHYLGLFLLLGAVVSSFAHGSAAAAGASFTVRRKSPLPHHGGRGGDYLVKLRREDSRRHLAGVDLAIGGKPTRDTGLYYTSLSIGTPAENYFLEIDVGSDGIFLNCVSCETCAGKNNNGMKLKNYDPSASQSSSTVLCTDVFCVAINNGVPHGCNMNSQCLYTTTSGDGRGFFVKDLIQYNQVSGDLSQAFDGIIGFGRNSSMLSQLAAAGKVKKVFYHCFDTRNGGGIFAVGSVVQPIVRTTTLVPNTLDYNVKLTSIDVAGRSLELPNSTFAEDGKSTIDTSTSLTYLPEVVYKNTIDEVFYNQPHTIFYNYEDFLCFHFSGRVDEAFPTITFHFDGDLALSMHPHDYLLHNGSDLYCVGFQNGRSLHDDRKDTLILGDLSLSDKLVIYDLERQVIGWTEYDCSSSIKLKDEQTGSTYDVHANRISSQGGHCHVSVLLSMFLVLGSYLI